MGAVRNPYANHPAGDTVGSITSVQRAAAPIEAEGEVSSFAPGVQKRQIQGDVLRWHIATDRAESIPALEYIHMLERENEVLKKQVCGMVSALNPGQPTVRCTGGAHPWLSTGMLPCGVQTDASHGQVVSLFAGRHGR